MIRVVLGAPLILAGRTITHLGYRIAGANHLNPLNRRPS